MPIRRILLELWAMALMSLIVGFLGPFGTYGSSELAGRVSLWWMLLIGAYILIRPAIFGLRWLARKADLPEMTVAFWGVAALSGPMAVYWRHRGGEGTSSLESYSTLIPFSLLCALAVLAVVQWAAGADRRLQARAAPAERALRDAPAASMHDPDAGRIEPALMARLSPRFRGPILALQSEDHYVRVHGPGDSELLLMRLRDAIAEMTGVPGQQVHRSWWVARESIVHAQQSGRSWELTLSNGITAPVARDSVSRLRGEGLLPTAPRPA